MTGQTPGDTVVYSSWADPEFPNESPVRGYVTALKSDGGELWATLHDGTMIHRREVDGVWEDVE